MATERRTDIGPPHYERFLPPIIKENYGKWKYHEILKPGVMVHVGESGDKLFTVRAGFPPSHGHQADPEVRRAGGQVLRWTPPLHEPAQLSSSC